MTQDASEVQHNNSMIHGLHVTIFTQKCKTRLCFKGSFHRSYLMCGSITEAFSPGINE